MQSITLKICDDGVIWVTSDEDQIGIEYKGDPSDRLGYRLMISLSQFLRKCGLGAKLMSDGEKEKNV